MPNDNISGPNRIRLRARAPPQAAEYEHDRERVGRQAERPAITEIARLMIHLTTPGSRSPVDGFVIGRML
jgi:hypothetical protein